MLEEYAAVHAAYVKARDDLSEYAKDLIGRTVLFRRGKTQVVLAEVIGAKGTVLTISNVESKRAYFVDLTKSQIVKIR